MVLQIKKNLGLLVLSFICQVVLLAQASFIATISPGTIGKNETAELRLMIENARQVEQVIPPSLSDFIVLSGPNQESGMESTNGVTRQYIGITYLLRPKKTGKFTIRNAIAKADGKTFKSNPVTLVVTSNATGNTGNSNTPGFGGYSPYPEPAIQSSYNDFIIRKGENLAEKINKNIFIRVEMSQPSCYIGEPVVVTYKLYTRLKSESSITKNPSFNGFSVIDLLPPGNNYYSVEKLNGREYNVYTLRKSQLYPLQSGPVALESAEVENNIHFIKEEYINRQREGIDDMFRDFTQTAIPAEGIHDEKVTLQSKLALIEVKPLPEKGKTAFFNGAVGDFIMEATLEKDKFSTDDAGKLTVSITGKGNMPMILAPDLDWPQGLEPYETSSREQLNKLSVPVSGTKQFEYPFTVAKAGTYTLPVINFSYFDVTDVKYKTIQTGPFVIEVVKGIGKKPAIISTGVENKTGRAAFFNTLFANRWLIVIPLAILILTGLLVWLLRDRKRQPKRMTEPALVEPVTIADTAKEFNAIVVNPLTLTAEKMVQQDSRGFYEMLNREMKIFLADYFKIPLSTINKKTIAEEADKKGVTVYTSLQIQELLDDIEWQLYTPFAAEDKMPAMFNKADSIIHTLQVT